MTKAEKVARKFYPHYTGENLDDVIKARKFFVKGYEQAEKDLARWISVNEKLPPEDEEVIVLTNEANGHILPIACHLCFAHIVSDRTMFVDYDGWNIPQVRYWMPCPELPEK